MAPPVRYDSPPLLAYARPRREGVMAPGPSLDLDHAHAVRSLLWLVAGALGLAELLLLNAPR
jgi:hypothetical protein